VGGSPLHIQQGEVNSILPLPSTGITDRQIY
jgi:hypothetical protein